MSQTPQRSSHKHVIMLIVLTGVLMSVLDGIVVNIALPTITAAFHVDIGLSQWSITGYMVTLTALLLFFGRLSDSTGKVPLFIAGFAIFTLASFACGLSSTLTALIVFRIIQAVGAAMVFSISGAILFLAFQPQERGRAMGYLGSTMAVGSILGPILGGFLVDALGWRYIFLINVPIGIILVTCFSPMKRSALPRWRDSSFSWPSAALFQSPNNTEIMNALPRRQTAIASSVSAAGRNLAMTLGIGLASLLLPLLLRLEGNRGTVMEAGGRPLAHGTGNVMMLAALVCATAIPFLSRNGRSIRERAG